MSNSSSTDFIKNTSQTDGRPMKFLNALDSFLSKDFIFSPRYRVWRHVAYWIVHINVWTVFWMIMGTPDVSYGRTLFNMLLWVPVFILYSYPFVYWAIPNLLLNGKVVQFFLLILVWGVVGLYINSGFRTYLYVPLQEILGFDYIPQKGPQPHSYLCMTTSAASPMIIKFFKLWTIRQRNWVQAQQEKITAELQLLKAQVHPHFLFNTLNNIYSFSLENSPKTPDMILKLSSLLGYMLNDCKAEEVRLEKEIEVMKNYIDLEKERYGNTIEIVWNVKGDMRNKFISPLLMLPFLENAFKHGMSEQIEKPWLGVEILINNDVLQCKIANSKNEDKPYCTEGNGIGIENVKKRLALMYPDSHRLEMRDERNLFIVSLMIELSGYSHIPLPLSPISQPIPAL